MILPLVHEIHYKAPQEVFAFFKENEGAIFLDSAQERKGCGRYSFIAIDPFLTLSCKNGVITKNNDTFLGNPFEILEKELQKFSQSVLPNLPPFQGGVAGYFGYELSQHLEKIPLHSTDDMNFPDMILGFYDVVIAFDTIENRAWIFSTGFPLLEKSARLVRAKERLDLMIEHLIKLPNSHSAEPLNTVFNRDQIISNFTEKNYCLAVEKVIDYILAGDIFEANISQRFRAKLPDNFSPFKLYKKLCQINPAPFSAYLNFGNIKIISASPERFLKLDSGVIETRPIKGTRRRGKTKEEDESLANELVQSKKDHAENVMIVDLLRNDLSRVSENHSVQVSQLCGLESYPTVHHLVSIINGKLRPHLTAIDLLRASYPGGSITGAPKIRAMEIIAELEPTHRGPYCGSIGYLSFNGNMDSSITIRTFCINNNEVTFQVGGAIVADSNPHEEYQETLTKAYALFKSLTEI